MIPFAGFCTLFVAFTMDTKQQLADFNDAVINFQGNIDATNRIELYRNLVKIIKFHSYSKGLDKVLNSKIFSTKLETAIKIIKIVSIFLFIFNQIQRTLFNHLQYNRTAYIWPFYDFHLLFSLEPKYGKYIAKSFADVLFI